LSGTTITIVVFAIVAIIGALIGLLGHRSGKLALGFLGLMAGSAVVLWLGYLFNLPRSSGIILYASIAIGLIAGMAALKIRRLAYGASGLVFGGIVGITVLHIVNVLLHYAIPPIGISIACFLAMAIFAALFSFKNRMALLLSTSFVGGYLVAISVMMAILVGSSGGTIEIVSPFASFSGWITSIKDAFIGFNTIIQLLILAICLFMGLLFTLLQSEFRSKQAAAKGGLREAPKAGSPARRPAQRPERVRRESGSREPRPRGQERGERPRRQETYDDFAASSSRSLSAGERSSHREEMDYGAPSPVSHYQRPDGQEYAPPRSSTLEQQSSDSTPQAPSWEDRPTETPSFHGTQEENASPFPRRRSLSEVARKSKR